VTQTAVITQAESASNVQEGVVKQKQETLAGEELRYSYTRIYAPADGYIAADENLKTNLDNIFTCGSVCRRHTHIEPALSCRRRPGEDDVSGTGLLHAEEDRPEREALYPV
jgi:thioredoxin reductase